jgi:hypothetical protein
MQTTVTPITQPNGLLAGAILEEYRDLLALQPLQAARKEVNGCQTSNSCGKGDSGQDTCCQQKVKDQDKKKKKKAMSWLDLPRA